MYLIQDGEICEIKDEAKAREMLLGNAQLVELLIAEILNAMDYFASLEQQPSVDELRSSLEWLLGIRSEIKSLRATLS